MEIHVLDNSLRRIEVVDKFESLIWSERWRAIGDFELDLVSTRANRNLFTLDTRFVMNKSSRIMVVESVEDGHTADGEEVLQIRGRSIEKVLEDRVAKKTMTNLTTEPVWMLSGRPMSIAKEMFDYICRDAMLNANDSIPFLSDTSSSPGWPGGEVNDVIDWEQKPDSLYNAIRELAILYDFGFQLTRIDDLPELIFHVNSASDRTTRQTENTAVIFAPGYDTIQNTTEFVSNQQTKNVAYVFSEDGHRIVYASGVDSNTAGFQRRIIMVTTQVPAEITNVNAWLDQQGKEALLAHRTKEMFDGEVNQYSGYQYGTDYFLGDLVESRNKDGRVSYKRVTEQIFVEDREGERSYPTLSSRMFESPGTWAGYNNDPTEWDDFTTDVWEDL